MINRSMTIIKQLMIKRVKYNFLTIINLYSILHINVYTQALLLYDHLDDSNLIFEALYQLVITFSFVVRVVYEIQNHDKVGFYNYNVLLIFFF